MYTIMHKPILAHTLRQILTHMCKYTTPFETHTYTLIARTTYGCRLLYRWYIEEFYYTGDLSQVFKRYVWMYVCVFVYHTFMHLTPLYAISVRVYASVFAFSLICLFVQSDIMYLVSVRSGHLFHSLAVVVAASICCCCCRCCYCNCCLPVLLLSKRESNNHFNINIHTYLHTHSFAPLTYSFIHVCCVHT